MNLPPNDESNNKSSNNPSNDIDKTSKKKRNRTTPKTHNGEFNMKAIIQSVAGIGLDSANDFSFMNIANNQADKIELNTTNQKNIQDKKISSIDAKIIPVEKDDKPSLESKIVTKEKPIEKVNHPQLSKKSEATIIKRSKKINKAKVEKVLNSKAFRKSTKTLKIMDGLIDLVNQFSTNATAKRLATELLIKWLMKEHPQSEPALLQLLDQHLDQG